MTPEQMILELLQKSGAFFAGHFRLTSGLHSGNYLQCAQAFKYPTVSEQLSQMLAEKIRLAGIPVDGVISPALGGILFGYEVSRQLNVVNIFAERDADNQMAVRRGFAIEPGQHYLAVEDVVTTGGSVSEVVRLVNSSGGRVAAVGCVADRSQGKAKFEAPFFSLIELNFPVYEPAGCPLCAEGKPIVKPGSRKV